MIRGLHSNHLICDDYSGPETPKEIIGKKMTGQKTAYIDNTFIEHKLKLKVNRLSPHAKLPTKAHETDAGLDLYADLTGDTVCLQGDIAQIPTGIAVGIPKGYCGIIKDRSSMGLRGVSVYGGVIDCDYTGPVIVMLHSEYGNVTIKHGDKIAQMLIVPVPSVEVVEVDNLQETERGEGGFGSSGR